MMAKAGDLEVAGVLAVQPPPSQRLFSYTKAETPEYPLGLTQLWSAKPQGTAEFQTRKPLFYSAPGQSCHVGWPKHKN